MKHMIMWTAGFLLCIRLGWSQHLVHGLVVDAQNSTPLPGVTIQDAKTKAGTISGMNGAFTLEVSSLEDSLKTSYAGYQTQKTAVGESSLLIKLAPSPTALNELVVTASRQAQQRTEVPVAISVISSSTLSRVKPVTLDQVLNKVSGVYMVDLGNEQHTMAIRQPIGYRSNFLYLQDGIPIRAIGDFNHNALIEINQAVVRTIEVIKGPSSSLYGSDAVGGAINFITKQPPVTADARLSVEGSFRGYQRADFTAGNTYNNTGVLVSGYYASQHHGYMEHSDFDKLALTGRVDQQLSKTTRLTGMVTWVHYHTDMNGGLDSAHFYGKDYRSFYTFNYRQVDALRAKISWERQNADDRHSQVTLYYRNNAVGQNPSYSMKSTDDPLKARGEINKDYFQSFGLIAQYSRRFARWDTRLLGGIHAEISPAGFDAHFIAIDKNSEGYFTGYQQTDSLLTDYNVDMLSTAAYLQLQTSPLRHLRLVAGVRYDRLDYDFDNHLTPSAYTGAPDERNHFRQLTPKVGLTYDFGDDRGIYLNYSIGFAPPDISDLYHGVKVPYLKPARYFNTEAGGWLSFDDHKGYADVSLYRMAGKEEIISVRLPDGSYINRNAGKTMHYGIEYTIKYKPVASWQFSLGGTNARHKFTDYVEEGKNYNGNEMNGAPHWIMNSEITFSPRFFKGMYLSMEWQHLSSYFMDPANTESYSGYELFNARINYHWRQVELWLHLINLTNSVYATTAEKNAYGTTYRPGPPSTFYFGVAYHFSGAKKQNQ